MLNQSTFPSRSKPGPAHHTRSMSAKKKRPSQTLGKPTPSTTAVDSLSAASLPLPSNSSQEQRLDSQPGTVQPHGSALSGDTRVADQGLSHSNPYMLMVLKRMRTLKKRAARIEATEKILSENPDAANSLVNADQLLAVEKKLEATAPLGEFEELLKLMEIQDEKDAKARKKAAVDQKKQSKQELVAAEKEQDRVFSLVLIQTIRFFYATTQLEDAVDHLGEPLKKSLKVLHEYRNHLFKAAEAAELSGDFLLQAGVATMAKKLADSSLDSVHPETSVKFQDVIKEIDRVTRPMVENDAHVAAQAKKPKEHDAEEDVDIPELILDSASPSLPQEPLAKVHSAPPPESSPPTIEPTLQEQSDAQGAVNDSPQAVTEAAAIETSATSCQEMTVLEKMVPLEEQAAEAHSVIESLEVKSPEDNVQQENTLESDPLAVTPEATPMPIKPEHPKGFDPSLVSDHRDETTEQQAADLNRSTEPEQQHIVQAAPPGFAPVATFGPHLPPLMIPFQPVAKYHELHSANESYPSMMETSDMVPYQWAEDFSGQQMGPPFPMHPGPLHMTPPPIHLYQQQHQQQASLSSLYSDQQSPIFHQAEHLAPHVEFGFMENQPAFNHMAEPSNTDHFTPDTKHTLNRLRAFDKDFEEFGGRQSRGSASSGGGGRDESKIGGSKNGPERQQESHPRHRHRSFSRPSSGQSFGQHQQYKGQEAANEKLPNQQTFSRSPRYNQYQQRQQQQQQQRIAPQDPSAPPFQPTIEQSQQEQQCSNREQGVHLSLDSNLSAQEGIRNDTSTPSPKQEECCQQVDQRDEVIPAVKGLNLQGEQQQPHRGRSGRRNGTLGRPRTNAPQNQEVEAPQPKAQPSQPYSDQSPQEQHPQGRSYQHPYQQHQQQQQQPPPQYPHASQQQRPPPQKKEGYWSLQHDQGLNQPFRPQPLRWQGQGFESFRHRGSQGHRGGHSGGGKHRPSSRGHYGHGHHHPGGPYPSGDARRDTAAV